MPREIYEDPITQEESVVSQEENGWKVDRVIIEKGLFVYLQGHHLPKRGLPTTQAIQAVNVVKRFLKESLRIWWVIPLIGKKNALRAFNGVLWENTRPYLLKYEFLTPVAQATYDFLCVLMGDKYSAKILAHVLEYDGAYRFRLQDLCQETSSDQLKKNPRAEIRRLLEINRVRDYKDVTDKFTRVVKVATLCLLFPSVKKDFIRALDSIDFTKLQFDEGERYWALQQRDYNYFGKNLRYENRLIRKGDRKVRQ